MGLNPGDPSLIDFANAPQDLFVLDLVYHRETALLRAARAAGLRAAGGLRMLVHQGAASLRAWTRLEPPVATMLQSLENDA